jgi:hypothetical protein
MSLSLLNLGARLPSTFRSPTPSVLAKNTVGTITPPTIQDPNEFLELDLADLGGPDLESLMQEMVTQYSDEGHQGRYGLRSLLGGI